ncbi:MAG: YceI family protein [Crocinitomicaceae bacterium]|jgi:polyisoprenoid-binding protein YceI|nr:YceI family protein [Crocinitomicaceae bacterium]MDP4723860.1 YceI family protein [Crocinitomicaceae bacterium]MDP4799353.1 YceI family protein [Crocinitomicaceae bacterium]MDP4807155.1 YceI family protein [Crocinitomicaceae bacterium]MDP4867738.1 YceI family protein [Crocinitomicaceae bacterium]
MRGYSLIFLFFAAFTSLAQQYKLSEGHKIAFTNPDVSGTFDELSAVTLVFDETKLSSSKLSFKLEVASINTGNGLMNKHAKGEEWFNADKYPFIEFTSSKIEKTSEGYKATGKLQMHGVSKEVSIPFTFSKKGNKGTFIAKFSVDRTDYQIGKKNAGVAETIKITATIPVIKK